MRSHVVQRSLVVPMNLTDTFEFFTRPENLERIMPSKLHFEMLTPSPIRIQEGSLVDFTLQVFGLPLHVRLMVTTFTPPVMLVTEQLKGPFLFWHHSYQFSPVPGGTRIDGKMKSSAHFGFLGEWLYRLIMKRKIEKLLDYRRDAVRRIFDSVWRLESEAA